MARFFLEVGLENCLEGPFSGGSLPMAFFFFLSFFARAFGFGVAMGLSMWSMTAAARWSEKMSASAT